MTGPRLLDLDFAKYVPLFGGGPDGDVEAVICDSRGAPIWSTDGVSEALSAQVRTLLGSQPVDPEHTALDVHRVSLRGERAVFLRPLRPSGGPCAGWVAAMVTENGTPSRFEPASLGSIARCLEEELEVTGALDRTAEELLQRYEELNLVYAMVGHIREYEHLDRFFEHLLRACTDHLDIHLAAIVHPDTGDKPAHVCGRDELPDTRLILSEAAGTLCQYVLAGKETLVVNDPNDPRREYLFHSLPHKFVAAPILLDQKVAAALVAIRTTDQPDFANSDRALLELVADQASIVMRAHGMLTEMRGFSRQMAAALISTVEAKDPYTRGHSERVSRISQRLGEAMGFQRNEMEQLYWGALLHDIGKIAVPDQILRKPGRLTDDEYTFVKIHPEQSYEILRHIDYLSRGAAAARYHQERYDGKGYPSGLAGKNIPVFARVIAVADTFDAITSSRSYRSGKSVAEAVAIIGEVAGTQLDPEVVQIFLGLCEEEPHWVNTIVEDRGETLE